MLDRIGGQHELLSRGTRDAGDRHRTLRATLDSLVEVCDAGAEAETIDALATLIDNSLVWRVSGPASVRFTLPVTIRDYAAGEVLARIKRWERESPRVRSG